MSKQIASQTEGHQDPQCWEEFTTPEQPELRVEPETVPPPEQPELRVEPETVPPPELVSLLDYMGVSYDSFMPYQDRYFARLRELLAFHKIVIRRHHWMQPTSLQQSGNFNKPQG